MIAAVWFRPHRHRCPEAATRDGLNDADFWALVFAQEPFEDDGYQYEPVLDDDLRTQLANPCPECGASGACGYDTEGRPMIHVTEDSDG